MLTAPIWRSISCAISRPGGLEPWLDTHRLKGGAIWTKEIEDALDNAEVVIALLSHGSYLSEICRAEQLRALRKEKCVIPLMTQTGAEIPLHLEAKQYLNFTAVTNYKSQFTTLLEGIGKRDGVFLKPQYRYTYVTAPPLPVNFVERPAELAALRNALIADGGGRHVALTALRGMGGIGKTILAQALCADDVTQQAFPDGIIWVSIGKAFVRCRHRRGPGVHGQPSDRRTVARLPCEVVGQERVGTSFAGG